MDEIEQLLATIDEATAHRIRPVVESLVGVGEHRVPLAAVNQYDVQHFLWHTLPTRWPTEDREDHELAWALGDFLEAAGMETYAALCRDRRTHEILAAWQTDPAEGHRIETEAQLTSGVRPPDTDVLTFGKAMQQQEARTHARVSEVLEAAIARGELDPSTRGFKAASRILVESFLRMPSVEYDGSAPVSVVRRERTALWAHQLNPRVTPFWTEVLPTLESEPQVPANVELSLAPAIALLEALADGVTLTGAGYLPPELAVALDQRFGWTEDLSINPRGEADIPPLQFLHGHLTAQRLVTRRGTKLTFSAEGRRCLAEPERLWRRVVAPRPRWRVGFEEDALAVMAACLIRTDSLHSDELLDEMAHLLSGKWRGTRENTLGEGVDQVQLEWFRLGLALGWWHREGGRWSLARRLSLFGRAAAVSLFWGVAAAPSRP